eukprot:scaffold24572_cov21-Tisochrysis_lutea.AAC.4
MGTTHLAQQAGIPECKTRAPSIWSSKQGYPNTGHMLQASGPASRDVKEMQSGQPMSNDAFSVTCVAARGAHGGHSWHQCQMEMHIVDTPGTNVILERQQRLTEEYVPRADLVLFVMSVDRAFSESEVVGEYVPHTLLVLFVTSVDGAFSEGEVGGGRDGMRVLLRTDLGAVYEERGEDHPLHGTGFVGSQHEGTCLVDWTVLLAACWEVFSICTQDH